MVVNFAVLLKCMSVGHTLDSLNVPVKDLSFDERIGHDIVSFNRPSGV